MKKTIFTISAMTMLFAGAISATVKFPSDDSVGQTCEQRKGKKLGPQDGTGPIHDPGTGGGTGAGRRAGRK